MGATPLQSVVNFVRAMMLHNKSICQGLLIIILHEWLSYTIIQHNHTCCLCEAVLGCFIDVSHHRTPSSEVQPLPTPLDTHHLSIRGCRKTGTFPFCISWRNKVLDLHEPDFLLRCILCSYSQLSKVGVKGYHSVLEGLTCILHSGESGPFGANLAHTQVNQDFMIKFSGNKSKVFWVSVMSEKSKPQELCFKCDKMVRKFAADLVKRALAYNSQ